MNPIGDQPGEEGQDRNQEAEPDVPAPDGGQIHQVECSAAPEERAGEVAAPRDREPHQRREHVQRVLGQEQRQVATPLLPPESVHLGRERVGEPEAVVAAPPQPVRPDQGDERKRPDDDSAQRAPPARDLTEQAQPGREREQTALGTRERRDAEDERGDPGLPRAPRPLSQQAQQAEQHQQREELRLEAAAAPGGEGPAHGQRPGRQPDQRIPPSPATRRQGGEEPQDRRAAGEAEPQRQRFRRDAEAQARRHDHHPQEVGVALDRLARVPDQAEAVDPVKAIPEADERVVAEKPVAVRVPEERRENAHPEAAAHPGSDLRLPLPRGGLRRARVHPGALVDRRESLTPERGGERTRALRDG